MDRRFQRRLVVVMVLAACCAGCGSPPLFQVETQILPDGRCQRTIWQPKGEMLPKGALEPAWNARWSSVGPVDGPPAFAKQHPSHGDHQYFMAKGTFPSPNEVPQHFRFAFEKSPETGASELTRSYDRTDYGLVVEHRWREKVTNVVTLTGFLKARDEFLDLAVPLAEKAIEQVYGGKYDAKNLVLEVRSQGRRFLEQASIVFYDNLSRELPDAEQYSRLAAVAKPFGLDLFDANGNLVDGEEGNKRIRGFLRGLISRGIRHRDGGELTTAEIDAVVDSNSPPFSTARDLFFKEHKTELETQLLPRLVRMTGLYHLPLAFLFRGGPRFAFSLCLPGELTETNGTIDGQGATSWRFADERLFPDGFEMKARSLDWRPESQRKILGRVVLADRASAEAFIEIVKNCPQLLEALRAAATTGEAKAIRDFQPKTEGERLEFTKVRELLRLGQPAPATGVELLRREATALEPLVQSKLARSFLSAVADLPAVSPRTLFVDEAARKYFTEATAASLAPEARGKLKRMPVDETFYYTTKYGSPLAYARPFDLLGQAGLESMAGCRVFDFGYGTIGHLRVLASLGADVTGVDVDPLLTALYSQPEDQGPVKNGRGPAGRVRLIEGRFPADKAVTTAVGKGFDLIISKNTLKKGYVHPERPVEKRRLLNLDVDDESFVRALHDALKPGGWVMIYNITPAPSPPDQPYKNWADGRCPFARLVWDAAGFDVIAFDRDDTPAIQRIAAALSWDRGDSPIDLKTDLFAQYSLMRKRQTP